MYSVPSGASTSPGSLPVVPTDTAVELTVTPTAVDEGTGDGELLVPGPGDDEPPGDVEPPVPGTPEPTVAPPSHPAKIADANTRIVTA